MLHHCQIISAETLAQRIRPGIPHLSQFPANINKIPQFPINHQTSHTAGPENRNQNKSKSRPCRQTLRRTERTICQSSALSTGPTQRSSSHDRQISQFRDVRPCKPFFRRARARGPNPPGGLYKNFPGEKVCWNDFGGLRREVDGVSFGPLWPRAELGSSWGWRSFGKRAIWEGFPSDLVRKIGEIGRKKLFLLI